MKKYVFILISIGIVAGLSSCSKNALNSVNKDVNHALDVNAKFLLTDAMTSTAFNAVGGDASLYGSIYIEHEGGDYEQMYNAETRTADPISSNTYNNLWGGLYANILNLKIAILKTSPGGEEAGNNVTNGIARVLLADNLGVLTDLYGDVPYFQTLPVDASGHVPYMNPAIDKQQDLYKEIQAQLDTAITNLQGTDVAGIGSQDIIYGGNKNLWAKAAYGLKARYLMHTLFRSTNQNTDLNSIINYVNQSFASAGEELAFNSYNGSSNYNPLDAFNESRFGDLGLSQSLAVKFQQLNDPRGNVAFGDPNTGAVLSIAGAVANGLPNGHPDNVQLGYPISIIDFAVTAPTELLSYHEILFLKAEAMVRLGQTTQALPVLQAAIEDAFASLNGAINAGTDYYGFNQGAGLSQSDADDYFTNYVTQRFTANPLQEVMLQKYLAFYGASGESLEAYNDFRRLLALKENVFTGSSLITLANPLNAQGKFPLRFAYGSSDVTANPNVEKAYGDGSYIYKSPVWWAGGNN